MAKNDVTGGCLCNNHQPRVTAAWVLFGYRGCFCRILPNDSARQMLLPAEGRKAAQLLRGQNLAKEICFWNVALSTLFVCECSFRVCAWSPALVSLSPLTPRHLQSC